ncbi:MAG: ribosome assembly RNA-binding protein YhbY [Deltaproteobacteria bacterium]|nr:ribosome assembly RNA-binding protein YhbY [Deltaproteobacteria bacterium]
MSELKGFQRRFLRGQAHGLKPLVHIGKQGLSESAVGMIDEALKHHELIKVRFVDFKEERKELAGQIEERLEAGLVSMVGHTATFFRQQKDPEKQKVVLPQRSTF